ncbi:homeobox-leucine zipper protein ANTHOCYANINLESS 2-like isoform X2 [Actinidia eriantha]|nr:homeobox-leucine zipper protein ANTHOCYANINLESS 2-like isoform X2 [Actinidia eriantha]
MEGQNNVALMGETFNPSLMARIEEDGNESRSENDRLEGASGDDQDTTGNKHTRRKKYHRHTPYQIQELEAYFKMNNHPDEKERLELGKRLSLESKQVKFWFQNRRTQMKTQTERHENNYLKRQNEELLIENIRMKEAMGNPICCNCGGPAILGEVSIEKHHLRVENARLKEELNHISVLANRFLGRPISSFAGSVHPPMLSNTSVELAVGINGFSGLSSADTTFPIGLDSKDRILNTLPVVPPTPTGISHNDIPFEKSIFPELALRAMDELVKLAQIDDPLWVRSLDGGREVLNEEEYMKICPPCIGMKPTGFVTEATRATGMVIANNLNLVETLLDANQWAEMFPCMIGRTSIIDVIFSGMTGSRNCALQLMHVAFQALSPLVPVRHVKFLRFCKQHTERVWAVVDVSIDGIREVSDAHTFVNCRRLPSGCIVENMPNGFSKVTWVEHTEYDESVAHHLYRPLLSSGMCFGAQKWLAALQRQCKCLAVLMSSTISTEDHSGITPTGRTSMVRLANRMTRSYCAGVCATVHMWQLVQVGNMGEEARLLIRNSVDKPGEPSGLVLSATTSVWMPVSHQRLFDFLRDEQLRSEWDELSHGGPMQEMVRIAPGQDRGNCVSLLRTTAANNTNQNATLILQETQSDASGSLIVYTAVDVAAMQLVMNGGDSASVVLLPSGFAIVPDSFSNSARPNDCNGDLIKGNNGGSLLTLGFQILVDNQPPSAKLTMESVDTVNSLIASTIRRIKAALHCN